MDRSKHLTTKECQSGSRSKSGTQREILQFDASEQVDVAYITLSSRAVQLLRLRQNDRRLRAGATQRGLLKHLYCRQLHPFAPISKSDT